MPPPSIQPSSIHPSPCRDATEHPVGSAPASRTGPGSAGDGTRLEEHFEFGANWRRFLARVDEGRIFEAEQSLRRFLALPSDERPMAGRRFLDAGCGSGLFSLAAWRLGAEVCSFDFDPQSVACAETLRDRYSDGSRWTVQTGSVLDGGFLEGLGRFDCVYSWGVLHHTGAMWRAIDLCAGRVDESGQFFLALYNDQGRLSELWSALKLTHQRMPRFLRTPYVAAVGAVYFTGKAVARAALLPVAWFKQGTVRGRELVAKEERGVAASGLLTRLSRSGDRGMSRWYDLVDWVGGWPFEVATPDETVAFLGTRGFGLERMRTVGGRLGCNEFVFRRDMAPRDMTRQNATRPDERQPDEPGPHSTAGVSAEENSDSVQ